MSIEHLSDAPESAHLLDGVEDNPLLPLACASGPEFLQLAVHALRT